MSRDKQIEEMANIIAFKAFEQAHLIDGDENLADIVATDLYDKGYRKASEVAREIFEEIEKARKKWDTVHNIDHYGYNGSAFGYLEADVDSTIYELKKKYTEEGK